MNNEARPTTSLTNETQPSTSLSNETYEGQESYLLMESGDNLLLETGDKIISLFTPLTEFTILTNETI